MESTLMSRKEHKPCWVVRPRACRQALKKNPDALLQDSKSQARLFTEIQEHRYTAHVCGILAFPSGNSDMETHCLTFHNLATVYQTMGTQKSTSEAEGVS